MSPQTVIGERTDGGWRPSAQLMAEWRVYPALQSRANFADPDRRATALFRSIWRSARATTLSPNEPIVTAEGRPTAYLLRIWP